MDLNTLTRPCKPSTYQGWRLCRWHDCWQGCESRIQRFDAIAWSIWLSGLCSEDLRKLLVRIGDCPFSNLAITDDHDIRKHLGWLLDSGRFRICGVAAQRAASAGGGNAALPVQATQPIGLATGRSAPASPVVQSPSQGFPANLDAAAAAFVLRQAARDGIPFCEECEKARQAELQNAPASAEPAFEPEPSRPQAAPHPPPPEDDSDDEIPLTRAPRRQEESAPVQAAPREARPEGASAMGSDAHPADDSRDLPPAENESLYPNGFPWVTGLPRGPNATGEAAPDPDDDERSRAWEQAASEEEAINPNAPARVTGLPRGPNATGEAAPDPDDEERSRAWEQAASEEEAINPNAPAWVTGLPRGPNATGEAAPDPDDDERSRAWEQAASGDEEAHPEQSETEQLPANRNRE